MTFSNSFVFDADALGVAGQGVEVIAEVPGATGLPVPARHADPFGVEIEGIADLVVFPGRVRGGVLRDADAECQVSLPLDQVEFLPATGSPSAAITFTCVSMSMDHRSTRSALAGVLRAWRKLWRASETFGIAASCSRAYKRAWTGPIS